MDNEILEYLQIVEMKLRSLIQDIQNIRCRLEESKRPTFFSALRIEDNLGVDANEQRANSGVKHG